MKIYEKYYDYENNCHMELNELRADIMRKRFNVKQVKLQEWTEEEIKKVNGDSKKVNVVMETF